MKIISKDMHMFMFLKAIVDFMISIHLKEKISNCDNAPKNDLSVCLCWFLFPLLLPTLSQLLLSEKLSCKLVRRQNIVNFTNNMHIF